MMQQEKHAAEGATDREEENKSGSGKDAEGTGAAAGGYGGPADATADAMEDAYPTNTEADHGS